MFSCAFTYSFEKIRFSSLQNLDSPSKNSYIGSYYQPPERILSVSRELQFPAHSPVSADQTVSRSSQTTRNLDSKGLENFILFFSGCILLHAHVNLLSPQVLSMHWKPFRRKSGVWNWRESKQRGPTFRSPMMPRGNHHKQQLASQAQTTPPKLVRDLKIARGWIYVSFLFIYFLPSTELDLKLQSAESRCKILEKQLEYMRKMVENAKKDKSAVLENQVNSIYIKIKRYWN